MKATREAKVMIKDAPIRQVTTFVAERDQWRAVRERALHLGITASQFLRDAMAEHLKRTAKEARGVCPEDI
jgi:hypothetical protein